LGTDHFEKSLVDRIMSLNQLTRRWMPS
jgi:hypothetical protein